MKEGLRSLRKQLRGRSLGTNSEAEYAQCEKSAARRGQTLSEWCREALLDAVAGPTPRPEAEVILSEILALRKIVVKLLYGEHQEWRATRRGGRVTSRFGVSRFSF